MRIAVTSMLILFVVFLSTPTIVGMIEKSCDTGFFYSMSEEEQNHKEVKAEFAYLTEFQMPSFTDKSSCKILSENLSKHDNVCSAIFIPPPDLI